MFSMGKSGNEGVKSLNAKKLDVNFDNDDFFNTFEPTNKQDTQKADVTQNKSKFVTKL